MYVNHRDVEACQRLKKSTNPMYYGEVLQTTFLGAPPEAGSSIIA